MNVIRDAAWRESLHVLRDRRMLAMVVILPAALTVLFGYAFESNAIVDIPLAVFDEDDSAVSRKLIDAWAQIKPSAASSPMFRIHRHTGGVAQARAALDGSRWGAVHIPKGFGSSAAPADGSPPRRSTVTLFVDGSDSIAAPQIQAVISASVDGFNREAAAGVLAALRTQVPGFDQTLPQPMADALVELVRLDAPAPLYNPQLKFLNYVLPGVAGLVLQLMAVTLMAGSIAREREEGTLEQIAVSPVPGWKILLGKAVPYFLLSMFDLACVWLVARLWFGLTPNGSFAVPVVASLLFVPAQLATGVLIGAVSRTRMQAVQTAIFYLMPALLLSGAYAPLEGIPESVRWVGNAFALTFFCRSFREGWFRDADLFATAGDLGALAAFSLIGFGLAAVLFRMRRG